MTEFLIPLIASFAPFFLWIIQQVLPYPELLEEITILLLTYPLLKIKNSSTAYALALASGFLFATTESVLYLFNIAAVGSFETFIFRILITSALHIFSFLIMLFFGRIQSKLIIVGLFISLGIHLIYNFLAV